MFGFYLFLKSTVDIRWKNLKKRFSEWKETSRRLMFMKIWYLLLIRQDQNIKSLKTSFLKENLSTIDLSLNHKIFFNINFNYYWDFLKYIPILDFLSLQLQKISNLVIQNFISNISIVTLLFQSTIIDFILYFWVI
jgi:hypothetical protein